jgi:hypothetical protein
MLDNGMHNEDALCDMLAKGGYGRYGTGTWPPSATAQAGGAGCGPNWLLSLLEDA